MIWINWTGRKRAWKTFPTTLRGPRELKKDEVIKSALGDHIYKRFVEAAMIEWNEYRTRVSEWEIQKYLTKF